jgi:hypothetical protein
MFLNARPRGCEPLGRYTNYITSAVGLSEHVQCLQLVRVHVLVQAKRVVSGCDVTFQLLKFGDHVEYRPNG